MNILLRNSRIKLPQGVLFWREIGTGIPVIFLHSAWDDGNQWIKLMDLLSKDIHCFTPDLLGFGESSHLSMLSIDNSDDSIDIQVECLANFLHALKLEKVYLIGHCLGGWIASSYALKYPENVHGIILLSPQGVMVAGEDKFWQQRRFLSKIPPWIIKILKLFYPFFKLIGLSEKIQENLQLRKTLLQYPTACKLLFNRHQQKITPELLDDKLPHLQVPCLLLQGAKDTKIAIAKSQKFAQLVPDIELKIIADGESNLSEFSADIVVKEIRDFLQKIDHS